ncbi:MAG: hypothetical protein HKO65_09675 [Gemmatimonadetes bacterium]|nr:hypothetical protein [Gemmatimonadota bacterium]NNM05361.1 hypothetical protein [Gemmatimonadota bacterium]
MSPAEEKAIQEELRQSGASCPRCRAAFRTTPIPPRGDVAYVRTRVLVECDRCGLRAALDLK